MNPFQSITDIVLLAFCNEFLFHSTLLLIVHFSVNTIFECLYIFLGLKLGYPLSTPATVGGMWVSKICAAGCRWRGVKCMSTYAHRLYFFMFLVAFLSDSVLLLILPLFKNDVVIRKDYFSLTRSILTKQ